MIESAIFSSNRPEWHIVDFACQLLGVHSVPILPELPRQQVGFILRNSASRWVFYDTAERRNLLQSLESTLTSPPELVAFVADAAGPDGVTITRLMGEGVARQGDVPIERFRGLVEETDPASLVYAGGLSGDPDRLLFSHRDLIAQVSAQGEVLELSLSDLAVSCLPLADGFQRTMDHLCFYRGVAIHYPSSNDRVPEVLVRERPSLLIAAPELYRQLYQQALERARFEGPIRRWLFRWAVSIGERHAAAKQGGVVGPLLALQLRIVRRLVYRRIAQHFGGRLRLAICGGPPPGNEVNRFFEAMEIAFIQHETFRVEPEINPDSEPQP